MTARIGSATFLSVKVSRPSDCSPPVRRRPGSTISLYHTVDIGLDPFPYNGVTTTCDALWMGVPVISMAGQISVARQGVRFLRSVGLDELLAQTLEDYVKIASDLARDHARLAALRSALRERMSRSPLVDAQRLTRDLETAYRAMWETLLAANDLISG